MKTVSLELAKQLKGAGFSEQPYFYWQEEWGPNPHTLKQTPKPLGKFYLTHIAYPQMYNGKGYGGVIYPAPTADEILDLLPDYIDYDANLKITRNEIGYLIFYQKDGKQIHYEQEKNFADAVAKMWLFFKEHNYIK